MSAITEQLAEALVDIIKISDRKHNAWDRAKSALAAYEASKAEGQRKHDPHTGPCPACGFRITTVKRRPLAFEDEPAAPLLWCCHVRGPDDVHPAPDYQTALKWSDMINDWSDEANAKFKDGEKVMSKAAPALWPWSPESHAQNLAKAIADFSPRLPKEGAENEHEPAGQSGSPGA